MTIATETKCAFTAVLAAALAFAPAVAGAEKRPLDLYEPIWQRAPFGPPPENPALPPELAGKGGAGGAEDEEAPEELTVDQEQLQASVGFHVLNLDAAGDAWVGFSDTSDPQKTEYHYVRVGDSEGEWTVKSADPLEGTVVLEKNGVEITRRIGEAAAGAKKGGAKSAQPASQPARGVSGRSGILRRPQPGGAPGRGGMSLRAQRQAQEEAAELARIEREQERQRAIEEDRKRREEEKERAEAEREELRNNLQDIRDQLQRNREAARELERKEREETAGAGDAETATEE